MSVHILRRIRAADDAEAIADYLAQNDLRTALRFLENTEETLQFLARFPSIGSPLNSERPELASMRTYRVRGFDNHLIFYYDRGNAIEVVRIIHGARDIERELNDL